MACLPVFAFMHVLLLLPVALAVPWIGPTPTPEAGLMAMNGMSPRPTTAPDLGSVSRELLKRASQYYISPPQNWCGFINGDYANPVACSAELFCSFTQYYAACCQTDQPCTFTTSCVNIAGGCTGSNCRTDVLYCPGHSSTCASFVFRGSSIRTNFFCDSTSGSSDAEYINDFYKTAVGSTYDLYQIPSGTTTSNPSSTTSPSSTSVSSTSPPSAKTSSPAPAPAPHKGLAVGAIAGIAAGAGCLALAAVVGIIVCLCMRHRRRKRTAGAQTQPQPQAALNNNPPMQQAYPNTAQNVQYPPPQPSALNEPPQYPGSPQPSTYASTYNGHPSPMNSPLLAHDPTNRMSNISPPPLPYNHSNTTGISPLSQKPPVVGDMDIKTSDYPKPPVSPANADAGGMGATLGHSTSNKQDQVHEVSGEPMHFHGQNQNQSQGQSQGTFHEVSAQPEPRYIAYSPTLSSQQESSYTTYTHSSVQDSSGTQPNTITNESFSGQRTSPGPWELPEQRRAH